MELTKEKLQQEINDLLRQRETALLVAQKALGAAEYARGLLLKLEEKEEEKDGDKS